jgi:hypothetical protein
LRNYGLVVTLLFACALLFEHSMGLTGYGIVTKLGAICAVFGLAGFWVGHACGIEPHRFGRTVALGGWPKSNHHHKVGRPMSRL